MVLTRRSLCCRSAFRSGSREVSGLLAMVVRLPLFTTRARIRIAFAVTSLLLKRMGIRVLADS